MRFVFWVLVSFSFTIAWWAVASQVLQAHDTSTF